MKYAAQIKGLLAETMGARSAVEDEQEYYLGGTSAVSPITPPFGLVQKRYSEKRQTSLPLVRRQLFFGHAQYVGGFPQQSGVTAEFRSSAAAGSVSPRRPELHPTGFEG